MERTLYRDLVRWLHTRSRWLNAGQNNLPAYLLVQIGARRDSATLKEMKDLLRDAPDELYVEQHNGLITRVGLKQWLQEDERCEENVPASLAESFQALGEARAQLSQVEIELKTANELLEEAAAHTCMTTPDMTEEVVREVVVPDPALVAENAELRRKLSGAESARRSSCAALSAAHTALREREEELRQARDALAKLEEAPLLDTLPPALAALLRDLHSHPHVRVIKIS